MLKTDGREKIQIYSIPISFDFETTKKQRFVCWATDESHTNFF